jgi:hypothetical protein
LVQLLRHIDGPENKQAGSLAGGFVVGAVERIAAASE